MRDATSNIQKNVNMAKKKQTLIQNLFKQPFSEGELMNILLPKEIELCKSCTKLTENFKLKHENFDEHHRKFLCFRSEQKCKKKKLIIRKKKLILIIIIILMIIIIIIILILMIIII